MGIDFEWDPEKAASNLAKHGVPFHEAGTVFGDPLAITYHDLDHSHNEDRYVTFGQTVTGTYVSVVHADRGDRTRIISARKMTRRERTQYEELT
ncbi:MAG: BrnT family toxin [Planctomycetaceae bacterium]